MAARPNLFDYATKELSQDAMICWLLKWAASEHRETDRELSDVGRQLANALLAKHDAGVEIDTVEVWQQQHRIDVLARINGAHVLLIEDKTDSSDHSGQLERYYERVKSEHPNSHIHPIYFKTGNYQRQESAWIEQERTHAGAGYRYKLFDRCDFLAVLEGYRGANSSLLDFRDYLQRLEDRTNSYCKWTKESGRGCWESWQGFFRHLEQALEPEPIRWWGYVPNASGGFLGLCWGFEEGNRAYMQLEVQPWNLERQHLCFKIWADDADKAEQDRLKHDYHRRIMAAGRGQVRRPSRMRRGNTMTVAMWGKDQDDGWLAFDPDGKFNLEQTVSRLKEAQGVLKAAMSAP